MDQRLSLNLRVTQRQILTPGLVQMVSVLALNKLELRDMITQEMVANPVLEELGDMDQETEAALSEEELAEAEQRIAQAVERSAGDGAGETETPGGDQELLDESSEAEPLFALNTAGTNGAGAGVQETSPDAPPPPAAKDPFEEIDFGSFFQDYLDPGFRSPAGEEIEKPSFENLLSTPTNLTDHLMWQLSLSAAEAPVAAAAESIIGNLDENGYLTATLEEITESGGYAPADVEKALHMVQEFDPLGVASRDLRECLLIQLKAIGMEGSCAWNVVSEHLPQVENKHWKEIAKAVGRPLAVITEAVEFLRKLDPRPGQRYNKSDARLIEPDVFIVKAGEEYRVLMNEEDMPQLRLNLSYRRLLTRGAAEKDVRNYIRDRYSSAMQLIKNIEQRKQTILRVCETVIRRQREFLDHGIDLLKPMMIKDVAEEVGVHPSTVSRAVADKYAHTPQGVFELRNFFSEAVNGPQGGATSLLVLKRRVRKMIEEEDAAHPLTDDHITRMLQSQGIQVTRRTVAKYREDLRIPSTHQRRVKS